MQLELYHVDAFCRELFSGNPAAVVPLNFWPSDDILQNIAAENNLAETAFYVAKDDRYDIRWFTPTVEVDLCGHATLAAAHVLFNHKNINKESIKFFSHRSGELHARHTGSRITLDFPKDDFISIPIGHEMFGWFSAQPMEAYRGKTDYMLVFPTQTHIEQIIPNLDVIEKLTEVRGVIVTAIGSEVDFVSRFFAPQSGIPEDPVTGSAHTTLIPYWSNVIGKPELTAIQLSSRKGYLKGKQDGDRVLISGKAKTYLEGKISIPDSDPRTKHNVLQLKSS